MNEYSDIIKQDQAETLRSSLHATGATNPDQEAALQKLSARTGVPLEAVRLQRPEVELSDKLASFDYEKVIKESPKLSAWMAEPKNAALAHDDWQNLSGIEKTLQYGKDYAGALGGGVVGDGVGRVLSGAGELYGVAARSIDRGMAAVLPAPVMSVIRAPKIPWYLDPEQILKRPGNVLKTAGDYVKPAADRQTLGTDVAGGIGQIGSQIVIHLATGGTASVATMMAQGADVMADKTAKDIADPALRDTAILAGGAITALTEKYGLDKLLNRVPPEVKNRALRFIADKFAAGGIEAAQEFSEGLLHDIARKVLTNKDGEILQGVEREMSAAAISAAIVRTALGVKGHARATEQEQFVKALTDQAGASKLRERMPDAFKAYLDQVTANGPVENVFIPADRFNEYFQTAGMDPAAEASKLGVQNFTEATLAGSDVMIPTSQFVTQLSGSDHLQGLWGDLRFNQGDMTLRESKQFEADRGDAPIDAETLQRMTGVVPEASGYNAVKEQIMGELVGRFDQATANDYATQYASVLSTLAERAGVDPMALADTYKLDVTMPVPDALRKALARVDLDIDPILERLRAGDLPSADLAFGDSLTDFVRKNGLREVGEVRDFNRTAGRKVGQKNVVRPDGLAIDDALQNAIEAGYFYGDNVDELTESDLIDALYEDAGGNKKYSSHGLNDPEAEQFRGFERLGEYLNSIGVNLQTMTNAEIKAKMNGEAEQAVEDVYNQGGAQTETAEFKAWFGDSKVVDAAGEPRVVYHGTNVDFETFSEGKVGSSWDAGKLGRGFYFSTDSRLAGSYAQNAKAKTRDDAASIMPVYLSLQNPLEIGPLDWKIGENLWAKLRDFSEQAGITIDPVSDPGSNQPNPEWSGPFRDALTRFGYDGVALKFSDGQQELVAFRPEQIKSATGNNGNFDAGNPNILYQTAQTDEATGLPLNSDGTVTVYHHTNAAAAAKIRATGKLKADAEPDVYVTTRSQTDTGYGDTAVAINVKPELLQIDDEFPDGRIDFRLNVGKPGGSIRVGIVQPKTLEQNKGGKRGSITIGANRKMTISLFEKADLSTFLHETGHFYLEVMGDLAARPDAAPQIAEDYAAILAWMGVTSRDQIEVKHHEMFARANEAYLMEGNSPSPALQAAFQRFKSWLMMVYKTVASLDVTLSPQLREVFDRMYATDQQIEAAQNETDYQAMFATAADAGMTELEFAAYTAAVGQTIEQGKERLQTKLMREMLRERTKQWKAARETMQAEVDAEVGDEPVYQAFEALKNGMTEDGIAVKLSRAELVREFGAPFLKSLPRGFQRIYAADGGVDLDTAAEMFGFDSGRSMIEAIANMQPRAALVERITNDRMREQHGDIRFDGTIAAEAINALHNDKREDMLKIELRAIRKKAAEVAPLIRAERQQSKEAAASAARERDYERRWMDAERKLAVATEKQAGADAIFDLRTEIADNKAKAAAERKAGEQFVADALPSREQQGRTKSGATYVYQAFDPEPMKRAAAGMIGQKQIRDLRPQGYMLAERNAAKLGAKAMKAGDYMTAAEQKQRELLNHYLYKEAARVAEEVESKSNWLADQGKQKRRESLGKAGADYLEQVDEILERYEFKKVPLNKLVRRESLAAWVDQQEALGNAVSVPEEVLNEARRVNWKQIPVDELRAVYDSVKNITHLAGLKNKLLIKGKQRDFAEVRDELLTAVYSAPLSSTGELVLPNMSGATLKQRGAKAWRAYDAAHLKIEQLVSWLDDGDINGAWARNFFDLADGAQTAEYDLHRRVTMAIDNLRQQMPSGWRAGLFDKVSFDLPLVTGAGTATYAKPTRYTVISIALNMGNEQNMQRLEDGNKFTEEQLQRVRDSLTDDDLKFVQGVWDAVELLWPDMAALEKRVSGLAPEKVEPAEFEVRGKTYRGGYFPLVYDSRISTAGEKQVEGDRSVEAFVASGFGRPATNKGATKKRQAIVNQPVMLDMNEVIGGHIAKVVKDISHREAVTALHNLLMDGQIKTALIDRVGEAYYRELRDWTKVLVNDRSDSMNAAKGAAKFAMVARTNLAIVTMGWKISTMMSQFSGFGPASDLVKPSFLGRALMQATASPKQTWAMVSEKSGEMRNRVQTIDRDVRDSMRRIADKRSIVADIQRTAFILTAYADRMVSVPTWLGGYNQALSEGQSEETAIRAGDRAVRLSQGAGGAKDLAAVQRNNELMKLMTMYYTPFAALYARLRDVGHHQAVQGIGYLPKAVARLIALVALPAVLGDMLAGRGPGDDEDEVWWSVRRMLMYPIAALPGIRDFSGLMEQKLIALSGEGEMNFAPSYNISPIVSAIGKAYKGLVSKPIDALAGKSDWTVEDSGAAFESSGLLLGLPTAQTRITGGYLYDLMTGDAQPENAAELMQGLLFKRPKPKK